MTNIVEFVKQQEPLFTNALSADVVKWEKESQFAIQYFQKNDFLAKTALSNPTSAQNAIINVAAIGISLNPASKLAYLVPRDGMVCLDISYMGLLHIAQESGAIKWGQAKIVYANDTYESNGIDSAPTHKYNAFGDRGEMVGVYCVVKTSENDYLTQEMSLAEIKQVQETSKAKNGPWVKFFEEMARKTVIKRAAKTWPRVPRLDVAIDAVNEHEGAWMEPVMPHKPDSEIQNEENARIQAVTDKVSALCDAMGVAEDFESLKVIFKEAYTATNGMKIQKTVQAIYAEAKERIGAS